MTQLTPKLQKVSRLSVLSDTDLPSDLDFDKCLKNPDLGCCDGKSPCMWRDTLNKLAKVGNDRYKNTIFATDESSVIQTPHRIRRKEDDEIRESSSLSPVHHVYPLPVSTRYSTLTSYEFKHRRVIQNDRQFLISIEPKAVILAVLAALAIGAVPIVSFLGFKAVSPDISTTTSARVPAKNTVSALGRLQPQGDVIKLSGPASLQNSRVEKLMLEKEGDTVVVGQVVAILDSHDRLQAAVEQAQKQVKVAQANLAKVMAGAKTGEIAAQKAQIARLGAQLLREKTAQAATVTRFEAQLQGDIAAQSATIARFQAQLKNAASEFKRNQKLYQEGVISASALDSKHLNLETAQAQLNEAKANQHRMDGTGQAQLNEAKANQNRTVETLQEQINEALATQDRIKEVRPTDVQEAQAQVEYAIAALKQAQAELELTYVKSPITGRVLKIHTRPGETVSKDGIVEMGKTNQMYVVAEVYESNIGKVEIGQTATITSKTLAGNFQGTVVEKGWKIAKKDVLNTDPVSDVDARVVEVKISLDPNDSKRVAGLTNLQVDVSINL